MAASIDRCTIELKLRKCFLQGGRPGGRAEGCFLLVVTWEPFVAPPDAGRLRVN